ncbi:MAG: ATP-binding protein [Patescibacteria group bacterium]|nr:ATP-binding protein [Patescibacteria group bacterium]MDD5163990.1 ATP-binding protein [Patescibacteria group bacterium]MDD5534926.1 ATP-binding protein [Patescibacteria group bacterium]
MTTLTKPILYNGFKVKDGLTVKNRIERIFFTEVYALSDGSFLYLFFNLKPNEIFDRREKYDLVRIKKEGEELPGVIVKDYSNRQLLTAIEDLTTTKGFDCVAGMDKLKTFLIKKVIEPLRNPEKFKKYRLSIPNGILLYGPPGCGKTFIVNKLAEELGYNFVELKPSSVAVPYVHGAVNKIAELFERAKLQAPSIVFIDDAEALIPKTEELSFSADIKKEEINQFKLELNNIGEKKILVVYATNWPEMIDLAILRGGRTDYKIYVPAPDFDARKGLFINFLSGRPCGKEIDIEKLAKMTNNYASTDIELIVKNAAYVALELEKNIDEKMLIKSINKLNSSISPEQIRHYEQLSGMERW